MLKLLRILLLVVLGGLFGLFLWHGSQSETQSDSVASANLPLEEHAGAAETPFDAVAHRQPELMAADDSSATALVGAEEPVPVELLLPAQARAQEFAPIDNAELAVSLSESSKAFRKVLLQTFPDVDLTDVYQYHTLVSDKRATFGFDLTDETRHLFNEWMLAADALHREMVRLRAEQQGLATGGMQDGRGFALVGFDQGRPQYTFTANVEAAISTGAHLVRWSFDFDPALGGTVDGRGMYVNVNDYEQIVEHTEFQLPNGGGSRIMVAEVPWYTATGDHMTHVAGTVGAWGYNSTLLGMAPRVWFRALIQQFESHVTNYGMSFPGQLHTAINPRTGDPQMKSVMGTTSLGSDEYNLRYTSTSRAFDLVLRDYPYYVHFYAAGNNGSGFGTLSNDRQLSKNTITIGAVSDVTRDAHGNFVSGGTIAGFSSRGPTFDGRIKPDLTANGVGLRSTSGTSGSSNKSGTSMATPNASGSTVLLIDYVHQRFPGHFFRSSTYKSLLMNTADDRGNPGPDYTFGWGIINVHAAGQIIRHHAENSYDRVLLEDRLSPGQTWTYTYQSDGSQPIRVSLAWLDVAGTAQVSTSDDRTPRLVNDLDLRITGPTGTLHQPFVMPFVTGQGSTPAFDPTLHNVPATTGDNFTDPAEQIFIAAPTAGTYTVHITHKGTLSGGQPQPFSLAVSGLRSATAAPATITSVTPNEGNDTNNFAMTAFGSGFVPGSDVLLRRAGSPVVQSYRVVIVGDRIDFRVDTAGIDKGYYDVVVRAPDGTESVLPNGFLMPVAGGSSGVLTLYSNTFETADGLTLTGAWAVGVPNQTSVSGPGSAFAGTQVLGTYLNGNYENNINIFATLPPFSTINRTNVQLQFRRWLGVAFNQGGNPNSRHRDDARIHYSFDGVTWTQIWESNAAFNESTWSQQTFNLPAAVNNRAQVYLRFQLQTDGANVSYGWNIDDLRVTAETAGGLLLPPVFTSTPVKTATQGEAYSYLVTTSDADTPAGELVLSAGNLPSGLSFFDNGDGTGLLSGTPTVSGEFDILLSVTDGDYTTWQNFTLLIQPLGGNTAPEIVTMTIPSANEGQFYQALIEAVDADGHALGFSVGPLPGWLAFTDNGNNTATLSGTPNVLGTYHITVTVSDGFETAQQTYQLTIHPRPQVGFTVSSVEVSEDAGSLTLYVARTLNDAGSVSVNYATQNGQAVAGTDFVHSSGTLSWADGELGNQPITVTILDDELTQGDREFTVRLSNLSSIATLGTSVLTVTILDDERNTAPHISLSSPAVTRVAVPTGMGLLVSGTVTDDGLPEWGSYSQGWTVLEQPSGATVGFADDSTVSTAVTFSHEGVYRLQFSADDGEFASSIVLTVEVTEAISAGLPTENLAVWLPLDESSGTTAADASGNNRNAELSWEPTWLPEGGVFGGALQWTASAQRGWITNSAALNNTSQMSWAFWLNPAGNISSDQGILGKRTSTDNANKDWGFWFKANSNNRITFDIGATRTETTPGIPANEWTHVAFVFDGSLPQAERMRLYVNGEFTQALSVASTIIQSNNVDVALASFQLNDNRNFIGMMDEVVIYHGRALSAEEVLQVMQLGGGNMGASVSIAAVTGAQAQEPVQLNATVTDDGLPEVPGAVELQWSVVAGPGTVVFDDPNSADTLATFALAGSYHLRLSADDGAVTTFADITIVVEETGPFAPILLAQPGSQWVLSGATVQLTVSAAANPEPEYQWFRNGSPIAGATGAVYVIDSMAPGFEGSYFVRVSNSLGHVDSDVATLTLLLAPPTPSNLVTTTVAHNRIELAWTDVSVANNATTFFELEFALGASGPWQPLASLSETEFIHTELSPLTTYRYRVRARNAAGASDWSTAVTVTTPQKTEEQFLVSFGDTAYSLDAQGRTWQSFRLRQTAGANSAFLVHSDVALTNTAGETSSITFSASSTITGNNVGQNEPTADSFTGNPFAWFDPTAAAQRTTPAFNQQNSSITYRFDGFDVTDEVTFELVIRRTDSGRNITLLASGEGGEAVTLLANADSAVTRFLTLKASGAQSYSFVLTSNTANWVGTINAMSIFVEGTGDSPDEDPSDAYDQWAAANGIVGRPDDETGGLTNLARYALGGDASTPLLELLPQLHSEVTLQGLSLSLTFYRIDDPAIRYAVWLSTDLEDWGDEPIWAGFGAESGVPGMFEVTHSVETIKGFLRLEINR